LRAVWVVSQFSHSVEMYPSRENIFPAYLRPRAS
jgi:hypothetical protein